MASNVNSDDYYAVLGVPRGCGDAELKRAYKKLALRWHPDKNPDNRAMAEDSFKKVSEAYDVLSDPAKRRTYDQFGKQGFSMPSAEDDDMGGGGAYFSQGGGMPGGARVFTTSFGGGGGGRRGNFHFRSADEIFREFFGGRNPFAELEEEFFGGMMGGMGGARGGGPGGMSVGMRGGFGGGGMRSLFDDPFFSDMGGMGMGGGMMQSSMGGGGGGMSFQSFSSSSMGGMSGGTSQSVQSTTRIENGRQVTRTTYTTRDANGNVTTRTEESVNGGGGGGGGGGMLGFGQGGGGMQMQSMQMSSPGSRGGGFGFRMGF